MQKKIKDMTIQEKRMCVQHLSYKFYDTATTPSILLSEEIKNNDIQDEVVLTAFHELESLEIQRYKLEEEYSATVLREITPLKRRFEYEQDQLKKKYQNQEQSPRIFNPLNKFINSTTEEQYEQERKKLLKKQLAYKAQIEKAARKPLDECNCKINSVFMRAIKRIYR